MRRFFALTPTLVAIAVLSSLGSAASASAQPTCGTRPLSSTHYKHVIWVFMENHSFETIIGSPEAPYLNELAKECGLATNYHNVDHPSLPNYIAATSGLPFADLSEFESDCDPSATCDTSAPSIFGQLHSWKSYEESIPQNCYGTNAGEYAVRHNPAPYYTTLNGCRQKDVPFTELQGDLEKGKLPTFSFVTPNVLDDMHDGSIETGDLWTESDLPIILNSSEYQNGETVVFVTWDEGENGETNECATNETDIGCHVATLVLSPSTMPGTQSGTLFNHYALLRSTEELLGLPFLGEAANANSMLAAFNL